MKGAFAFDGIVGAYAAPYTPGTAYVLLHHCFGEVNGKPGVWGHAVGGMGAITQAMAPVGRGARRRHPHRCGRDARPGRGWQGDRRRCWPAASACAPARVAANVGPKLLFRDLVPDGRRRAGPAPPLHADQDRLRHLPHERGAVRAAGLHAAGPASSQQDHHGSGIVIGPTLDYLERAYLDARAHGWSRQPVVEMLIPSTLDDSLAPAGRHVASLFVQHVAPQLPDGRSWDDIAERTSSPTS